MRPGRGIPSPTELIPPHEKIVDESLAVVPPIKMRPSYIEANFYEVLNLSMKAGYEIYLDHEKAAKEKTIQFVRKMGILDEKKREEILWNAAINFEKSASQMRKARAGMAFELYVHKLLDAIGIPSEKPMGDIRRKLNRTDLVVPNKELASRRPDRARFLSIKTTLAERWKQVVPEQNRGWSIYLLTLDTELSVSKAKEIEEQGIVLYVRDELKSKEGIAKLDRIRKLSELPEDLVEFKRK